MTEVHVPVATERCYRLSADITLVTGQAALVNASAVPPHTELLWPTISAVRGLGGSGSIDEVNERVLKQEGFL